LLSQSSSWKVGKKQKEKSGFLMFAKLSAEKRSLDNCHTIEKAKRESKGGRSRIENHYFPE
jgi:hypothetical protein